VYTDSVGDARYRNLNEPYSPDDWTPPLNEAGILVAEKAGANSGDDDLSLSLNLSKNPAPLALVHRGPDLHLHLKYFDGKNWSSKDVKIGLQDPSMTCDEASTILDFAKGLGFLYWCQWRDPDIREQKKDLGHLRFCLVKDVAALLAGEENIRRQSRITGILHRDSRIEAVEINGAGVEPVDMVASTLFGYLNSYSNLRLSGRGGTFSYEHVHDLMRRGKEIVSACSPGADRAEAIQRVC